MALDGQNNFHRRRQVPSKWPDVNESGVRLFTGSGTQAGSRAMPHFGQLPGSDCRTSGCMEQVQELGWGGVFTVLALMLVVRPINVFLSWQQSDFTIRQRFFLAWIAPRGIVAAAMASFFLARVGSAWHRWGQRDPGDGFPGHRQHRDLARFVWTNGSRMSSASVGHENRVYCDVLLPVVVVQEETTVLADQHSKFTVGVVVDFLIAEEAQEAARSWLLDQGFRIVEASDMPDGATAAGAPDQGSIMPAQPG